MTEVSLNVAHCVNENVYDVSGARFASETSNIIFVMTMSYV